MTAINRWLCRVGMVALVACAMGVAQAATVVVTNADDDGPGSLRSAILEANALAGPDTIAFQIGQGPQTISVLSPLPSLDDATTIDGTTQPGYQGLPLIEIEGTFAASTDTDGLVVRASGCTLRGLCLNRFGGDAVRVTASGATIEDCFLGLDPLGETGLGCTVGVAAESAPGLTIQRCALVGLQAAVLLRGSATGSLVQRCTIGTDAFGLTALGTGEGIVFEAATGAPAVRDCLLGGCEGAAIRVTGSPGVSIEGTVFGLSALLDPLVNLGDALWIDGSANVLVRQNLIAFALRAGVLLTGSATANTRIEDTTVSACTWGIEIGDLAHGARVQNAVVQGSVSDGVLIHTTAGSDNQFNASQLIGNFGNGAAVFASDQSFTGCRFEDNNGDGLLVGREPGAIAYAQRVVSSLSTFRSNGDFGIRLETRRDLNRGANGQLAAPTLAQAFVGGAIGSLTAAPNRTYRIEFYASLNPDPSGFGEGELYLGFVDVVTDGGGNAPIIAANLAIVPEDLYIAATATSALEGTSEFSRAVPGTINGGPILEQMVPDTVVAGTGAFTLSVHGQDFTPFSKIQWDGVERATTFISTTELRTTIAAADVAVAKSVAVTVYTPAPGGGTSAPLTFVVANAPPVLDALTPNQVVAGAAAFTLSVTGSAFVSGSIVRWNGEDRATTFVSPTELRIAVSAADVATAGTASVTVFTPTPGGGVSAAKTFTILNPTPTVTALTPSFVFAGTTGVQITVDGTGFVPTSQALWDGAARTTNYVNPTRLFVDVGASDLAVDLSPLVSVSNPSPGGGVSGGVRFRVVGVPLLALASASAVRTASGVDVTVTLRNVGTATVVGGRIKASRVATTPTTTVLPVTFPDIPAGATSAPIVLTFPSTLAPGRTSLAITATAVGRTYSASRVVTIP